MITKHFTLLRREKKYHGKIIDLTIDYLQYPSGREALREIVEHPGGAVVIPLFENKDLLLVRQYRHPFGDTVIELPAGKLEKGEDPFVCAQRELREETGYGSDAWKPVTSIKTTPGFCNEVLHLFRADCIYPVSGGPALEEGESTLTVQRVTFSQAMTMIATKEITDAKTIVGILMTAQSIGRQ
jgi:ADP-ribose pyrophosphatase